MITDDDLIALGLFIGAIVLIVGLGLYARRIRQKAGGGFDWFASAVLRQDLTRPPDQQFEQVRADAAATVAATAAPQPRPSQDPGDAWLVGYFLCVPSAPAGLILAALLEASGITTRVVSDPLPVLVGAVVIGAIVAFLPALLMGVPVIERAPRLIGLLVALTALITPAAVMLFASQSPSNEAMVGPAAAVAFGAAMALLLLGLAATAAITRYRQWRSGPGRK